MNGSRCTVTGWVPCETDTLGEFSRGRVERLALLHRSKEPVPSPLVCTVHVTE